MKEYLNALTLVFILVSRTMDIGKLDNSNTTFIIPDYSIATSSTHLIGTSFTEFDMVLLHGLGLECVTNACICKGDTCHSSSST